MPVSANCPENGRITPIFIVCCARASGAPTRDAITSAGIRPRQAAISRFIGRLPEIAWWFCCEATEAPPRRSMVLGCRSWPGGLETLPLPLREGVGGGGTRIAPELRARGALPPTL